MAPARTKKIFISDIHMGDARSFAKTYPYGWFRSNIPHLANFLNEQLSAPEVAEVVILGDLFDEWVIPTDVDPLNSFQAICDNPPNSPVIEALRQLAARGILTYVPGNHDMTWSTTELAGTQKFMETAFPGICYSSDPNLPNGVYRSGKLVAEHGNRYALFNASDTWTKPPSFLPMGYFLSRMVAYKVSHTETKEEFHDIIKKFVMKLRGKRNFVRMLFMAVAHDAGLSAADPINMNGIPGFPGTVGAIGSRYENLIEDWKKHRPDLAGC
jgi:DNA repair exonuclease SbcCD nuclease subunit